MHKNSLLLFKKYAMPLFNDGMKILEIGPDGFPSTYCQSVSNSSIVWDTLDIYENEKLTFSNCSQYKFPIANNSYDIVLSGQVMEHVKKIWLWIEELERICMPNGLVIIISPVSWPYHEAPIDCWRIYPEGMRALLEDTSLEIIDCHFESLEATSYSHHLPGKSLEWVNSKLRIFYKLFGPLGFPVERAYDLITIAKKKII